MTPLDQVPWTKGPWTNGASVSICGQDDAGISLQFLSTSNPERHAEGCANARLIAESPTMAALLEEYVECSPCQNGCAPDDMTCLTNRARALLSRLGRGK